MPKFDLEKTSELAELFETPREQRDADWIARFFAAAPDATLAGFTPQVELGPDQFPYFQLSIPAPGPLTPFCVTHVLEDVLQNGCGIAIFADVDRSNGPQWVFSYGDLLSYSLFGRFDGDPAAAGGSESSSAEGAPQVLQAAPGESYFPRHARRALGGYMRGMFQHPDPKVTLIVDPKLNPPRNLMINLTLEQYQGDQAKLSTAMRYLTWFIPRGYSLLPMPHGWSDSGFIALE